MIDFGRTGNYEQSYENENDSSKHLGESVAFSKKNLWENMSRSSSLVSIRPKSGSRLRVTTGCNVMAGYSSKFTLNRFPFPEKADFPVGIGGENRATNGRDSINL